MATNDKKISNLVTRQLPEFVQSQSPALLEFVKKYYTLMESAQINLSNVGEINQIRLETADVSFVQLDGTDEFGSDATDYIVDEQSAKGEFANGETITGATSGQTATVLIEDADNNKLYVTANTKFITGETITGGTSGATATIQKYRANPVENITQLLEYTDVNQTLDDFFVEFKKTFLNTIPDNLASGLNKRQIATRIGELYARKGTVDGHKAFFRLLFDEEAEVYLPTRDLLRVSDGDWGTKKIIKVVLRTPTTADTSNLLNQTITQTDKIGNDFVDTATAIVNGVTKEFINGTEVTTLFLEEDSITGDFRFYDEEEELLLETGDFILLEDGNKINQETNLSQETEVFITGVDNTNPEVLIQCVVHPSIDQVTVTDRGAYYSANDSITFTAEGAGKRGTLQIEEVSKSGIAEVKVDDGGSGYAVGDVIVPDNTGTEGSGFVAEVRVVNGGFTLETEARTGFQILDETGGIMVMEDATNSNLNDITDIKVTNQGGGYSSLPTLSVTSSGSGCDIFPVDTRIGQILEAKVLDHGFNYQTIPTVNVPTNMQIEDASDSFVAGETVTMSTTRAIIDEPFENFDFNVLALENVRPAQYRLEDATPGGPGGIQYEIDTQNFLDEPELSLVDDRPGRDVVSMTDSNGRETIVFAVRENPENDRIILEDVVETDQDGIIVLEDGNKVLIEDQDTVTATVLSYDGNTNLLKVTDVTGGEFVKGETLTGGTSGATAKIVTDSTAQISTTIGGIVTTSGEYSGVKGQVSESTKKIQDSDYWQDYSYVIKVGESLKVWKDDFKRSMHPAGFNFFGEVTIATQVSAKMKTGFTLSSGAVEADEVVELFSLIFSEKIGRRLGTDTDGTSLNSNPTLGIEGSASFDANTRDVTLTSEYTLKTEQDKTESVQGVNVRQGFIYAGPRYKTINRFASTAFQSTSPLSGITIATLNNIKIRGTGKTPPNEETPTFATFNSGLRTNFAIPTDTRRIIYGSDSFDEDATTFDDTNNTFDAT